MVIDQPSSQKIIIPPSQAELKDYEAVASDFQIVEFIEGDIIVTPPPIISHQRILRKLFYALQQYLETNTIGEVFIAPTGVKLPSGEVLEPDLMVILNERQDIISDSYIVGVPHIVIEILSPSTQHRDWGTKRKLYEKLGVTEYWLIDPEKPEGVIFRQDEGRKSILQPIKTVSLHGNEFLETPLLPKFHFSLD